LTNLKIKSDIYAIYFKNKYLCKLESRQQPKTITMKTSTLTIFLLMILWLSGCAGSTEANNKDSEEAILTREQPAQESPAGEATISGSPIHLTKSDFLTKVYDFEKNPNEWVFAGDKPCIIDFYADWCKPCKMIAPILNDLAKKYDGQLIVYKINTDQEKELAQHFGIQSIPTLLFCPMNGKPQMAQGAIPQESFEKVISEVLLVK
jgi:thioredoxin